MARPTKLEQAAKLKKLAESDLTQSKDFKPVEKMPTPPAGSPAPIKVDTVVAKTDITIINVSDDNDVLKLLDLQEKLETEKLKKVVIPDAAIPAAGKLKLGIGMIAYYDTKLGKHGTEKANILKSMMKFDPARFKLA